MEKLSFYSYNLNGGSDTRVSAEFYERTFGWKILNSNIGHSELRIDDHIIIVLSRPTINCPVFPGTLTLVADEKNLNQFLTFTKEDFSLGDKPYESYLDPWGNRIWVYYPNGLAI